MMKHSIICNTKKNHFGCNLQKIIGLDGCEMWPNQNCRTRDLTPNPDHWNVKNSNRFERVD